MTFDMSDPLHAAAFFFGSIIVGVLLAKWLTSGPVDREYMD